MSTENTATSHAEAKTSEAVNGAATNQTVADTANQTATDSKNVVEEVAAENSKVDTQKTSQENPKEASGKSKEDERLLAEVMEKKEKLRKAQGELDALRAKINEYGGIDPKEVRDLKKREQEAKQKEAEAKGDFELVKKMMAEEHKRDIEAREKEIAELKQKLDQNAATIDNLTLGANFANSKYINENLILTPTKARALYGSYFDLKDGQIIAYDKPAGAADRAPLIDGSGNPYNFDTAFQKIIEADPDRDTLVRSKIKEGARSRTDNLKTQNRTDGQNLFGKSRILAGLKSESSKKL